MALHINRAANPTTVVAAILSDIPMVYELDQDPVTAIETGDWVEVDDDRGIVKVTKKEASP